MTARPPALTVEVDYELYADYLEDAELSEAQKREFLQTLWSIIVAFVDLGFGVHPVRQACGKLEENPLKSPSTARNELYLDQQSITGEFDHSADLDTARRGEGVGT